MYSDKTEKFDGSFLILNMDTLRRLWVFGLHKQPLSVFYIIYSAFSLSISSSLLLYSIFISIYVHNVACTHILLFSVLRRLLEFSDKTFAKWFHVYRAATAIAYKIYNQETTLNVNVDPEFQTPTYALHMYSYV